MKIVLIPSFVCALVNAKSYPCFYFIAALHVFAVHSITTLCHICWPHRSLLILIFFKEKKTYQTILSTKKQLENAVLDYAIHKCINSICLLLFIDQLVIQSITCSLVHLLSSHGHFSHDLLKIDHYISISNDNVRQRRQIELFICKSYKMIDHQSNMC